MPKKKVVKKADKKLSPKEKNRLLAGIIDALSSEVKSLHKKVRTLEKILNGK